MIENGVLKRDLLKNSLYKKGYNISNESDVVIRRWSELWLNSAISGFPQQSIFKLTRGQPKIIL